VSGGGPLNGFNVERDPARATEAQLLPCVFDPPSFAGRGALAEP